jgi:hypothetical protein
MGVVLMSIWIVFKQILLVPHQDQQSGGMRSKNVEHGAYKWPRSDILNFVGQVHKFDLALRELRLWLKTLKPDRILTLTS